MNINSLENMASYLQSYIDDMLQRPGMFGTNTAVEAQFFLCCDLLIKIACPEFKDQDSSDLVKRALSKILMKRFGSTLYPVTAYSIPTSEFVEIMTEIRDAVYAEIRTHQVRQVV